MRTGTSLKIAAVTLSLLCAGALAQQGTGTGTPPPAGGQRGAPPAQGQGAPPQREGGREGRGGRGMGMDFEGGMKLAGRGFKALKDSPFDASSRARDLEALQGIEQGLIASKAQAANLPMSPKAKEKFGTDAAAYQTALRKDLNAAVMAALMTEQAVLEGKSAEAKAAFAKLGKDQESGHSLFQKDEG